MEATREWRSENWTKGKRGAERTDWKITVEGQRGIRVIGENWTSTRRNYQKREKNGCNDRKMI